MNLPHLLAGLLVVAFALTHSFTGERKVFPELAEKRGIAAEPLLSAWHFRVLRGTWHTLSLFGFGLAAVLFTLAIPALAESLGICGVISISTAAIGAYWAYVTRFWHFAWVAFFIVSLLCWWG